MTHEGNSAVTPTEVKPQTRYVYVVATIHDSNRDLAEQGFHPVGFHHEFVTVDTNTEDHDAQNQAAYDKGDGQFVLPAGYNRCNDYVVELPAV